MSRVGIDEAGRGCLCGGLFIAGLMGETKYLQSLGARDSKKLSFQRREQIYENLLKASERGDVRYHVSKKEAWEIDQKGLSWAMKSGIEEIFENLGECGVEFVIDGNSTFKALLPQRLQICENPVRVSTLVKGDDKFLEISCASILAKVSKDRQMLELDRHYPHYALGKNKGYGTAEHIAQIERYGYCPHHRRSFKIVSKYE